MLKFDALDWQAGDSLTWDVPESCIVHIRASCSEIVTAIGISDAGEVPLLAGHVLNDRCRLRGFSKVRLEAVVTLGGFVDVVAQLQAEALDPEVFVAPSIETRSVLQQIREAAVRENQRLAGEPDFPTAGYEVDDDDGGLFEEEEVEQQAASATEPSTDGDDGEPGGSPPESPQTPPGAPPAGS